MYIIVFITVVYKVIEDIIKDEGFSVPSPAAISAKEIASLLMRYCNFKQEKESMWGHYHLL